MAYRTPRSSTSPQPPNHHQNASGPPGCVTWTSRFYGQDRNRISYLQRQGHPYWVGSVHLPIRNFQVGGPQKQTLSSAQNVMRPFSKRRVRLAAGWCTGRGSAGNGCRGSRRPGRGRRERGPGSRVRPVRAGRRRLVHWGYRPNSFSAARRCGLRLERRRRRLLSHCPSRTCSPSISSVCRWGTLR